MCIAVLLPAFILAPAYCEAAADRPKTTLKEFASEEELLQCISTIAATNQSIDRYWADNPGPMMEPRFYYHGSNLGPEGPRASALAGKEDSGVDGGEMIINDGGRIYQISGDSVVIGRINPNGGMEILNRIASPYAGFRPEKLFLAGSRLVLAGSSGWDSPDAYEKAGLYSRCARIVICDVSDLLHPKVLGQLSIEGVYAGAARIGNTVYCLARKPLYEDQMVKIGDADNIDCFYPHWAVGLEGGPVQKISLDDIWYAEGCISKEFVNMAAINIDDPGEYTVRACLGAGPSLEYDDMPARVSTTSLYICTPARNIKWAQAAENSGPGTIEVLGPIDTRIDRLDLGTAWIGRSASATVSGNIPDSESISEYDGYLRLASLSNDMGIVDWNTSPLSSNVFVLDGDLKKVGQITGMQTGGWLSAACFSRSSGCLAICGSDRDSLYKLDLSNPRKPRLNGEPASEPCISRLYALDNQRIIGLSRENVATRLLILDVGREGPPVEVGSAQLGPYRTWTEFQDNYDALMFDPDSGLLALPVKTLTAGEGQDEEHFQGALVYSLDSASGLTKLAQISYRPIQGRLFDKSRGWFGETGPEEIRRVFLANNQLCAISDKSWAMHSIAPFRQLARISTEVPAVEFAFVQEASPNRTILGQSAPYD